MQSLPPLRRLACLLVAVACLLAARATRAEEGAADAAAKGAAAFDEAVRWLRGGRPPVKAIADFHADLMDVQFEGEEGSRQGHMRLWLKAPDKYRFELRQGRPTQGPQARVRVSKILDGGEMWILESGGARRMHGSPEGAGAIAQMQQDRRRLLDLARFLTLESFRGEGVELLLEGSGKDTVPGQETWVQVRRRKAGAADVVFRFARARVGGRLVATHPIRVTVVGTEDGKRPTETYDLGRWTRDEAAVFPARIEAWSQAGAPAERKRFLLAHPRTVRINTGLPDDLFRPPP